MSKIIKTIGLCLIILLGMNYYVQATPTSKVSVELSGKAENGEKVKLLINVENIDSLYAADFSFKYDKDVLNITSIEKGEVIQDDSKNPIILTNKVDKEAAIGRFVFTCTGKIDGYTGNGTFLVINAEIKKNSDINILQGESLDTSKGVGAIDLKLVDKTVNYINYVYEQKSDSNKNDDFNDIDNETNTNETNNNTTATNNDNSNDEATNNTGNSIDTNDSADNESEKDQNNDSGNDLNKDTNDSDKNEDDNSNSKNNETTLDNSNTEIDKESNGEDLISKEIKKEVIAIEKENENKLSIIISLSLIVIVIIALGYKKFKR